MWLALVLVLRVVLGGEDGLKSTHMITMTKSHSFPKFSTSINPRIEHDIKLLGSAKLSSDKQSIQIPDISESDDLRHQAGRAIYSSPIRVFDPNSQTPASFETTFSFQLNNHTSPLPSNSTSEEAHGGKKISVSTWFYLGLIEKIIMPWICFFFLDNIELYSYINSSTFLKLS